MQETNDPIVFVNGKRHVLPLGAGEKTLLQYLRGEYTNHRLETLPAPISQTRVCIIVDFCHHNTDLALSNFNPHNFDFFPTFLSRFGLHGC
jgi:hypothetical protein